MSAKNQLGNILNGKIVLIVEDDADSLEVAETLLQFCGANVITAVNGGDGFAKAIEHQPIFIVADLSMPDVNGWAMLDMLKADSNTQAIPVIALTAHALVGDREKAIAAGFHNYLSKPLNPDTFISQMLRLVMDTPKLADILVEK